MSTPDINSVAEQLARTKVGSTSELSFAGKGLKLDTENDAAEVVQAIEEHGDLHILRLEGNTIGVDAAKALSKALEKHPEFERAKWSDMFTGRLKSEIPQALRYLGGAIMLSGAQLVELDLSDNAFGPNGMDGLIDLLKSKSCFTLKELRLNNNGLGTTGGKMLAKCLLECHKQSSMAGAPLALRAFVSGRGRLENDGSIALAEAFKAMGSLEEVSMPQNGINHAGITALADAFSANKKLRVLNLNDNTFTERGAIAMAKALPHMQKLEVINFGDCLIRTKGAMAIGEALRDSHQQLRELTLSFNEIRQEGATMVAEAMETKDRLEKLELDGNQLGEDGKEVLQGTLESIGKLEYLGSLSDDEGTEDEEEEEEEEDEDAESDGEEPQDEDEEDEKIIDPNVKVNGISRTPKQETKTLSAADFLQFPSPTKLDQLSGNKAKAILDHIKGEVTDVDRAVEYFIKVSSIVKQDDTSTKDVACECTDGLFKDLSTHTDSTAASMLANSLLTHLGLIKSEDKVKPPSDISGPLLVLEHAVKQPYFSTLTRDILKVFIDRPHPLLTSAGKSRHLLLQTLYKF